MIYTFYSYKGGVGRTMALANIGQLLYERGLRVLMIDWDLEAPGLEKFFNIKNDSCKKGLLDMLLNYKKTMISEIIGSSVDIDSIDEPIIEPNEIKKLEWNSLPFLKPSDILIDIYPQSEGLGKLFLITAGMRSKDKFEDYSKAVVNFDWADFYKNWAGEYYFEKIGSSLIYVGRLK